MRKFLLFLFIVLFAHNVFAETNCDPRKTDIDGKCVSNQSIDTELMWENLKELDQALFAKLQELREESKHADSLSTPSDSGGNPNRTSNGDCKLTGALNYESGACSCGKNAIQSGDKCVCDEASGYFYRNGFCVKSASNTSTGRLLYGKDRTSF